MSYTELEQGYQGLRNVGRPSQFYVGAGDLELCDPNDITLTSSDMEHEGKVVFVGVCAMAKKSQSKPMKEILTRLQEFEYIKVIVFPEEVILQKPVEEWPVCDCLISFHSKGFPLDKAIQYAQLHNPYVINNLHMQYDIQDRRKVYSILESEGIEIPRYAVLDRDCLDPKQHELVESEDHVEVNGVTFNKPFVEKPVSAEDHNIYIYYPTSAGGGSQRLFRKIGSRSSVYSPESRVRKTGSFIYEDFMPTDGTDVKVYTVGPDYAHAEARKSPALDGKVERDRDGKEIRYPVILSNAEKLISRKVCLAFKQAVCGFDLLRANGKSFVCDVNGFSFVKNSNKYYDDCAKILGNMILRELAPTLHIPWSVPFQLDDPPIVPTTFGKMMELRCVVAVIRHGDRTPKQKMKVEVRHPKFFEIFEKYDGYKHGHVKLKRPKQLQEILDIARSLLAEIQQHEADPEIEEKQGKLEQLKSVLEMYGHFSGINRKVQMKYQPKGRPRGSSSDDDKPAEPSLVLILKWGGELTPAGRIQAEELGRIFRCMYPGGQGRHLAGEYAGAQGLGLLRLHSTFRHDLKIYASDEGRVQMTAAAFAKGLLALEGELTPILVQMVKSANTNGLLDNDCDSSKFQNMCKSRLHEIMQIDKDFTQEDREKINPCNSSSIADALDFVKNPFKCCKHVHGLIKNLLEIVQTKREDVKTKDAILYHGETWELMGRRWGKIEKDFYTKSKTFDISKIPDIYDCIKYDLQHNQHTLQFEQAEELYIYSKYLADIVIPQEYGLTQQEKLTIGQGICTPLLKKIRADLQRNIEETEENVNRLNPRYSHGVSSPGRHVRTRLYFTSESHIHSLITVLRHGGLLDIKKDEQWRRAMEYISMVSELNYMSQVVIMLYEDPTKDPFSDERFHVELHFSPGVNCCVQKNLPPGPGFRPHSRNESSASKNPSSDTSATATPEETKSQISTKIEEESEPMVEEEKISPESAKVSETSIKENEPSLPSSPDNGNYYRNYKTSDPIPIRSSHTVSGHEALNLAKQLNEELANQAQQSSHSFGIKRSVSPDPEPRARSYDHKSPQKAKAEKVKYQSLDAVNSQEIESVSDDTDSVTPTNTPFTFPIVLSENPMVEKFIDDLEVTNNYPLEKENYLFRPITYTVSRNPNLSPISGSFDLDRSDVESLTTVSSRNLGKSPVDFRCDSENASSRPASATNELPLTELNLALFTSEQENSNCSIMSTNELPLTDIKFSKKHRLTKQNTFDSEGSSLDVHWDSEVNVSDEEKPNKHPLLKDKQHRSFSDPNIVLDNQYIQSDFLLDKYDKTIFKDGVDVSDDNSKTSSQTESLFPFEMQSSDDLCSLYMYRRSPSNLLSFFTSPPSVKRLGSPRSLSSPIPCFTDPYVSSTEPGSSGARRHRHGIAGQMSYYKMLGFGLGGTFKKLTGGSTNSLFSTAVISGSSSAPNLRDMIPTTASTAEGFGGVPPIRPLETLHNALSLRQIDSFLDKMTSAPLYRTPSATPPKNPSTPLPTPSGSITDSTGLPQDNPPLKYQSPNNSVGWSGPPSFVSSSGPSSPGYSDNNSKENSEMSSSIVSGDGFSVGDLTKMFPTAAGLDHDLGTVGMLLNCDREISGSIEFSEYYTSLHHSQMQGGDSGEVTPVSGSEVDFNTNDATAGSTADCDITVTEDVESSLTTIDEDLTASTEVITPIAKLPTSKTSDNTVINTQTNNLLEQNVSRLKLTALTSNVNLFSNPLQFSFGDHNLPPKENIERISPTTSFAASLDRNNKYSYEKNLTPVHSHHSSPGSDKWSSSKEKFMECASHLTTSKSDNCEFGKNINIPIDRNKTEKDLCELGSSKVNPGVVVIKEGYIDPPALTRISKNSHNKSPNLSGNVLEVSISPRRSSDVPSRQDIKNIVSSDTSIDKNYRPPFLTQKSQPCGSTLKFSNISARKASLTDASQKPQRFKTILVKEEEHAARMGISARSGKDNKSSETEGAEMINTYQVSDDVTEGSASGSPKTVIKKRDNEF